MIIFHEAVILYGNIYTRTLSTSNSSMKSICYIILRSSESFDDEQELSFVRTIVIEETGAEFQHSVDKMSIRKDLAELGVGGGGFSWRGLVPSLLHASSAVAWII